MDISNWEKAENITAAEVEAIVNEELPQWKKACENAVAEIVIFHQDAFGNSFKELLLMAITIKYARLKGKSVTVVP